MTVGIALAGGGVKAAAHIGILRGLEEEGIYPDGYAGTSAGALIAAAKAVGLPNEEIEQRMNSLSRSLIDIDYLGILRSIPNRLNRIESVLKGQRFKDFLWNVLGDTTLSDAKTPLVIVTTDIHTGTQVVFHSHDLDTDVFLDDHVKLYGPATRIPLHEIVYASSALPGIFPPYLFDGQKLTDGSIVNNLPGNALRAMNMDTMIAIDLMDRNRKIETSNIINNVEQSINILLEQSTDLSLGYHDEFIYLNPGIDDVGLLEFEKISGAYNKGYTYGQEVAPHIGAHVRKG